MANKNTLYRVNAVANQLEDALLTVNKLKENLRGHEIIGKEFLNNKGDVHKIIACDLSINNCPVISYNKQSLMVYSHTLKGFFYENETSSDYNLVNFPDLSYLLEEEDGPKEELKPVDYYNLSNIIGTKWFSTEHKVFEVYEIDKTNKSLPIVLIYGEGETVHVTPQGKRSPFGDKLKGDLVNFPDLSKYFSAENEPLEETKHKYNFKVGQVYKLYNGSLVEIKGINKQDSYPILATDNNKNNNMTYNLEGCFYIDDWNHDLNIKELIQDVKVIDKPKEEIKPLACSCGNIPELKLNKEFNETCGAYVCPVCGKTTDKTFVNSNKQIEEWNKIAQKPFVPKVGDIAMYGRESQEIIIAIKSNLVSLVSAFNNSLQLCPLAKYIGYYVDGKYKLLSRGNLDTQMKKFYEENTDNA